MRLILEGRIEPVQAGIFLIALRMKRETDDENKCILEALRDVTRAVTAPVDTLVDIADPYDGFRRSLPMSPLLPAVLAACGVPVISHGVESVGPSLASPHLNAPEKMSQDGSVNDSQAIANTAAQVGQRALEGEAGPARDSLIYAAAVCLWHLGQHASVAKAADDVREVLDSGEALTGFHAAL